ncbi:MAG: hypothetical protein ACI9LV_000301 [Candidatus Nanohaloarchaea archaeon]|jgi:hypothetical protein
MTTQPLTSEKNTIDYKTEVLIDSIEGIVEHEGEFDPDKWLSGEMIRETEGDLLSYAVRTMTAFQHLTARKEEYFESNGENISSYIGESILENVEEARPYHLEVFEEIKRCYHE